MTELVALVTASSAGLGAAAVKGLARSGFSVVINFNSNKHKADKLVGEVLQIRNSGVSNGISPISEAATRCIAIQADVSRREETNRLVAETIEHFGRLDCVVSNQGWTKMRNFDDLDDNVDEDDWDTCFNMNVKSHLFLFHEARPHLSATKGSFITTASLAGVIPSGSSVPYAVTKAAQIHLVKSLAKIAAPEIVVNSISPGILLTEWGQKFPEAKLTAATEKGVLKRLAGIDDVVRQIVLLAESRSVTGQNFVIDAGWSLG